MKAAILILAFLNTSALISQTLVGYWSFSGNTADSSGMGNHGTIVSGSGSVTLTTDRCGNPNSAYNFNNGRINIGTTGFPTGNGQRTLCAWFKRNLTPATTNMNIIGFGDNTFNGCRSSLAFDYPNTFWVGNENRNATNYTTWVPDTNWHFLCAVFPQGATMTSQFKIYFDGILSSDTSFLPATLLNTNLNAASIGCLTDPSIYYFHGKLDDLRIYSTALTDAQVWLIYSAGGPQMPVPVSPANNSSGIGLTPLLDWNSSPGAASYRLLLSADSNFAAALIDTVIIADSLRVPSGRLSNNVKYFWKVRATNCASNSLYSTLFNFTTSLVGISQTGNEIPDRFSLSQNYPNPFNPTTNFEIRIADYGFTNLTVFDALGKEVETLVNSELAPGVYKVDWNAAKYPSGVYFYKLKSNDFTETKKMVLIK